jgi:hypothetical protein
MVGYATGRWQNKRWVAKQQEDGKIRDGWLSNMKMAK